MHCLRQGLQWETELKFKNCSRTLLVSGKRLFRIAGNTPGTEKSPRHADFTDMNLIDFIIVLILSAAIWLTAFAVKKGSIWKYVFGAAFTVYLMCAASITVFPIQFSPTIRAIFAEEGWKITDCIVLVPFKDGITADDIRNAAMTVPFGVLITLIRKKTTWKNALAAGAAFGTATELLQLAIAAMQGFSFRYIDTADIICNLAGTMLGWMLTALLIRFLQKSKPANVGEKSLYAYISEKCVKQ